MSFGIEGSFRRDILGLLLAHYASPHTKFLTVPEPLLPNKPRGVPRVDDRRVLNGIFWVLRSGAPWRDLPERYGPRTTCYNRFARWRKARSEEHTSELQSLMRISYAVFCLKKTSNKHTQKITLHIYSTLT